MPEAPELKLTWIDEQCFVIDFTDPGPGADIIVVHLLHSPGDHRPWSTAERHEFGRRMSEAYRAVRVPPPETLAEAVDKILAQELIRAEDLSEGPRIVRHRSDTYDPER